MVAEGSWASGKDWGWFGAYTATTEQDDWDTRWRHFFAGMAEANPDMPVTFIDFHI